MNIHFQELIPDDFDNNSRVWVYQSNRAFSLSEVLSLQELLENFTKEWNSHGSSVKGFANLFFGQFLVIMADETHTKIGGCSTDSSIRFIKNIQKDYNTQLLDRQMLAFIVNEKIQLVPLPEVNHSIEDEFITSETLYFNNTILTKKELLNNWIIPVKDSWLAARISSRHLH
ncbi:MAG: hypothetical protein ABI297_00945 [Ginsengibacter sp.]